MKKDILMAVFLFIAGLTVTYAESFTATWEHDNPDNVDRYNNQYKLDSVNFVPESEDGWAYLGATTETTRTFQTIIPSDATQLTFRVRACNSNGCSDWIEAATPVNVAVGPAPPINVVLIPVDL